MAVLTSNYPTSLDTTSTLGEVANRAKSTLAVALASSGETQISLANASGFPDSGALTIDNEIFYYSSKSGNVLTIESRSQQGTTGAAHLVGALVYLRMTKGHWDVFQSSVMALQSKLGVGSSTPTAAGHILGVNGSGQSVWGTPSSFGITNGITVGDAVSGGSSNTILFKNGSGNLGSSTNLGWDGSVLSIIGNLTVTDDVYSISGWNNNLQTPTKNAIRDRLQLLHNYAVLEDYADLPTAISTIGSTVTELRISNTVNVTSGTITIPENIYVSFNGNGIFNISSGAKVIISSLIHPGERKLYTGLGKLSVVQQSEINITWWTGKPTPVAALTTTMWEGIKESAEYGVILRCPVGRWTLSAGVDIPDGFKLYGAGSTADPSFFVNLGGYHGTIFHLTSNDTYCFRMQTHSRSATLKDFNIYLNSTTGSTGIRFQDVGEDYSADSFNFVVQGVGVYNGDFAVDVYDPEHSNWLVINLKIDSCFFLGQKVACFRSQTANSSYNLYNSVFEPRTIPDSVENPPIEPSVGILLDYAGPTKVEGCTFNGFNIIGDRAKTFVISSIDTTGGSTHDLITTSVAHGIPVGKFEPVTITTTGTFPAPYTDRLRLFFYSVSSTTGYLFKHPAHQALGDVYRYDFTSAGTGTLYLRTTIPLEYGTGAGGVQSVPFAAIKISGHVFHLSVDTCQDEGFQYSVFLDGTDDYDPTIGDNTGTGPIRPLQFTNSTFQSGIQLNTECYLDSFGNTYVNYAFKDDRSSAKGATIHSVGDAVLFGLADMGSSFHLKKELANFVGFSKFIFKSGKDWGTSFTTPISILLGEEFLTNTKSILELVRNAEDNKSKLLLSIGTKSDFEEVGTSMYDFWRLNDTPAAPLPVGQEYMAGWLKINSPVGGIYNGVFVDSHLAFAGRSISTSMNYLGTSGTVSLDGKLGHNYGIIPTGDVTVNITASSLVAGQRVTVFIAAEGTSYTIFWGTGFSATGQKRLITGTRVGTWIVNFKCISNVLIQDGQPVLASPTVVSPEPVYDWQIITGTTVSMAVGQRYLTNTATLCTLTLPAVSIVGDTLAVAGMGAGGWKIAQSSGQSIEWSYGGVVKTDVTTTGTSGYLQSGNPAASVELLCTVANTTWKVISSHLEVNVE